MVIGIAGIFVLLILGFFMSSNHKYINYKIILSALIMQFCIGWFAIYSSYGKKILGILAQGMMKIISYGDQGSQFIFGPLVSDKMFEIFENNGFVFAFRVLPIVVFFSSLISVLYHLNIMQKTVNILGNLFNKILGTSHGESLCATANIFLGQTEAPMLVKPFLARMTKSEIFVIMSSGLASISVSALAGYTQIGIKAEYLIAASFMSAPGSLVFAKLIMPETEKVQSYRLEDSESNSESKNMLEAAAEGGAAGMQLAINICAMLLAFISLIALTNGLLSGLGNLIHLPNLSIQLFLGYLFTPIAIIIGIPWHEAQIAGALIGQKLVINEFVAYCNFSEYLQDYNVVQSLGLQILSERTKVILSFALCGFANLSSIAILLGGLGSMVKSKRNIIAKFGLKAVVAGTLSNLMSAEIANIYFLMQNAN